jgi:hypothetical protein
MESSASVPVLSFTISALVAGVAAGVVALLPRYFESLPSWVIPLLTIIIIPLFAYLASISGSIIFQYGMCKKVNLKSISLGNMAILGLTSIVSIWLFLENVPFLKYIFGEYGPTNPTTGEQYPPDSVEYKLAMETERHYKLQPLSGIVKVVLPQYYSESVKDGVSYMYWIFWATMLPSFFLFTVQGASC